MKNKCVIMSRYGSKRFIEKLKGEWYFDCQDCLMCRYGSDPSTPDTLAFVDPDGGPFVSVGASLKFYHRDLPDIKITSIVYEEKTKKYKLGTI